MRLNQRLIGQLARPQERATPLVARMLNASNKGFNALVVDALEASARDHVLDVGFGGGVGLRLALKTPAAHVTGVEISAEMVALARRSFAKDIRRGRLVVQEGAAEGLPFDDATFTAAAYSVNSIYFWHDQVRCLEEIRRVLTSDGRLLLGVDARSAAMFASLFRGVGADDAESMLRKAGFADVVGTEPKRKLNVLCARSL